MKTVYEVGLFLWISLFYLDISNANPPDMEWPKDMTHQVVDFLLPSYSIDGIVQGPFDVVNLNEIRRIKKAQKVDCYAVITANKEAIMTLRSPIGESYEKHSELTFIHRDLGVIDTSTIKSKSWMVKEVRSVGEEDPLCYFIIEDDQKNDHLFYHDLKENQLKPIKSKSWMVKEVRSVGEEDPLYYFIIEDDQKNDHLFYHDLKENQLKPILLPIHLEESFLRVIQGIGQGPLILCFKKQYGLIFESAVYHVMDQGVNVVVKEVSVPKEIHKENLMQQSRGRVERQGEIISAYEMAPGLLKIQFQFNHNHVFERFFTVQKGQTVGITLENFEIKKIPYPCFLRKVGKSQLIAEISNQTHTIFHLIQNGSSKKLEPVKFDFGGRKIKRFKQVGPNAFQVIFFGEISSSCLCAFIQKDKKIIQLLDTSQIHQNKIKYLEDLDVFQIGLSLYDINQDEGGWKLLEIPDLKKQERVVEIQELGPFIGIYFTPSEKGSRQFSIYTIKVGKLGEKQLVADPNQMEDVDYVEKGSLDLLYCFKGDFCHVYAIVSGESETVKLKDIEQVLDSGWRDVFELGKTGLFNVSDEESIYYYISEAKLKKLEESNFKQYSQKLGTMKRVFERYAHQSEDNRILVKPTADQRKELEGMIGDLVKSADLVVL